MSINGLEGLGVPINFFPPLLELPVRVFLIIHIKARHCLQYSIDQLLWGSHQWLAWPLKFSISSFCWSVSFVWACIFWSFWLPLFWEPAFCSFDAPDELILFVTVLIFGILICKPNIEMYSAWNWVKFVLLPCVFKKLHAIAAKYGSCNWEANWVLSASLTLFFHEGLALKTFWPKIWSSLANWSSISQGCWMWL